MPSIREQIIDALIDALNTDRPPEMPIAERARGKALNHALLQKIIVYPVRDSADNVHGTRSPLVRRTLEIAIECWAPETEDLSADAAADPLLVYVIGRLTNNRLGGLCHSLEEAETNIAMAQAERIICLATITMVADYQHRHGDLEQRT